MIKKLFISKNESELSSLTDYCLEHNIDLTANSFLNFKAVHFIVESAYDILFFSSPRSVVFYQSQYAIPKDAIVACVGAKTKDLLNSFGVKVSFNGSCSDSTVVGEEFKIWCAGRKVLFPLSNISKKTISKQFPDSQKIEVVVYETSVQSFIVPSQDCYVFTSPSNVIGYFNSDNELNEAIVISWGKTTEKELLKRNVTSTVLSEPSIPHLISVLQDY